MQGKKTHLIHRNYLAVTSSSSATFDTERWSLGGLTHTGECRASEMCAQGLSKPNGSCRLALTQRSGCNAMRYVNLGIKRGAVTLTLQ